MQACPFCGAAVTPSQAECSSCLASLPTFALSTEPKRATTGPALSRPPRRRPLDLSDDSTEGQAPVLQALAMEEAPLHCALHPRARATGSCRRCQKPACEICQSHEGVCAACRRERAPRRILDLSRDVAGFTALAGAALFGFASWQWFDRTVLDVEPLRLGVAAALGLVHGLLATAVWRTRSLGVALACTGVVVLGVLTPMLGGEPWWMAPVRLGLALLVAARTLALKRQLDELYLPLDRAD